MDQSKNAPLAIVLRDSWAASSFDKGGPAASGENAREPPSNSRLRDR